MPWFRVFILLMLLSVSFEAWAQGNCFDALIKNKQTLSLKDSTSLALVSAYQQSSGSDSEWSADASGTFEGIPLEGSTGLERSEFNALASYFRKNYSREQNISIATQTLGANAVRAFESCINSNTPIKIFAYDATENAVTIEIVWNAPAFAPTTADAQIAIQNGKPSPSFPAEFVTGQSFSTTVIREANKDLRIVANIGGYSQNKTVIYVPNISVKIKQKTQYISGNQKGKRWRLANDGSGRESSASECAYPPQGWSVVRGSAQPNISKRVGNIDHRTYAEISKETSRVVCFSARMYPLTKEGGGDLWFRPSFLIQRKIITVE